VLTISILDDEPVNSYFTASPLWKKWFGIVTVLFAVLTMTDELPSNFLWKISSPLCLRPN